MTATVRRREGIVAERVGADVLLLDADRAVCSELNPTGALLWERLPATAAELVDALVGRFPVPSERAAGDVQAWVAAMAAEGWVLVDP